MKATVKIEKEFDLKTLWVRASVRYWEDATVDGVEDETGELMPCATGDMWCPIIDIDSGIITNWKQGVKAEVHYKVADQCGWELKDINNDTILFAEDGYVPSTLCPKDSGYGDYIIMDIDENGKIADWKFDIKDFEADED